MDIVEILLLGVGLSMDAFAVSVGKGLSMQKLNWQQGLVIAAFFGSFQALMPVLGWLVGAQFNRVLSAIEGWIAFALLAFIGLKMIWDASHEDPNSIGGTRLDIRELLILAVATSIDAFAAGIALGLLNVNVVAASLLIGATTFVLSLAGVGIGHTFGRRWEKPATIMGGIVLVGIGVKILLGF